MVHLQLPTGGPGSLVAWHEWDEAAFARAGRDRMPILLWLAADWCRASAEMARTSFADPAVARDINARFVPIRVDVDARPDVAERYGLGGWPTTAFLSPDGGLLGGGTFIEAGRMPAVLGRVLEAWAAAGDLPASSAQEAGESSQVLSAGELAAQVFEAFDPRHGGFGSAPKFPLVAPVRLALWGSHPDGRSSSEERIAVRTLEAMGWAGLFDDADGGFFDYAAGEDWSRPHTAKRLASNAALIRLYLEAGAVLGLERFTARGLDTLAFVQRRLADPEGGGWFHAQRAGDPSADPGKPHALPPISHVMYADANAAMVSAALDAAAVLDDAALRQFAITSLERVLLACYRPGDGVAHFNDGHRRSRGLLSDQLAMAEACLDALDVTGNQVYGMMAEELMHFALRTMWHAPARAFADRATGGAAADLGRLATPVYPFVENCGAAVVLRRLARTSGEPRFGEIAADLLGGLAPRAAAHGPLAAHYLLAHRACAIPA